MKTWGSTSNSGPRLSTPVKVLITALAFACCLRLAAVAGEPDDVLKAFQDYKSAIVDQKGEVAAGLVTQGTIDEYQHYLDWALSADRETLESLPFMSRFQVLLVRQRIPADTLKRLNGRSLFAYMVDKDWLGKSGVNKTTLGKVEVSGDRALAETVVADKVNLNRVQFAKENGAWKFDLGQVIRASEPGLKASVKRKGVPENDFLFNLIESISGKPVEDSIWVPLGKKAEPAAAGKAAPAPVSQTNQPPR